MKVSGKLNDEVDVDGNSFTYWNVYWVSSSHSEVRVNRSTPLSRQRRDFTTSFEFSLSRDLAIIDPFIGRQRLQR